MRIVAKVMVAVAMIAIHWEVVVVVVKAAMVVFVVAVVAEVAKEVAVVVAVVTAIRVSGSSQCKSSICRSHIDSNSISRRKWSIQCIGR